MWVRGGLALDGFFALPREEFGAPTLAARRTVVISALPKVLHLLWLYLLWTSPSARCQRRRRCSHPPAQFTVRCLQQGKAERVFHSH